MTIIALTAGYTSQSLSLSFKNFKNPYSTFPLKIFEVTVTKVPALGYGVDWEDMDYERMYRWLRFLHDYDIKYANDD